MFFRKHNPDKDVQALLAKYAGNEEKLLASVREKFGVVDTDGAQESGLLEALLPDQSAEEALGVLDAYDPSIAAMARSVLDLNAVSNDDFAAMLELEMDDEIEEEEDNDGGSGETEHVLPTKAMSREEYVVRMVRTVVLEPVASKLSALRAGWHAALPHHRLVELNVTPVELRVMLGGESESSEPRDFSWREVFRCVEDAELIETPILRNAFWRAMEEDLR